MSKLEKIKSLLLNPLQILRILMGLIFELLITPHNVIRLLFFRSKVWICFNYENGLYSDFYANIYLEFEKNRSTNKSYQNIVLTNLKYPIWSIDTRYKLRHFCPSFLEFFLSERVVFHATQLKEKYRAENSKVKNIQINHGFGSFVTVMDSQYVENVSMFVCNTEKQYQQLTIGEYKGFIDRRWVRRDGYPKLDNIEMTVNKTISNSEKTIFYGPTYHKDISSVFDFLDLLIDYCKFHNIRLIIKLHPLLYRRFDIEKSGGVDWVSIIKDKTRNVYSNIELLKKDQSFKEICRYFADSDLFVTDNSGFGYEYVLLTGKPIVFLGSRLKVPLLDVENSTKYQEFPEVYYRGRIGPIISSTNFESEFDNYVNNDVKEYANARQEFRENFTFNLGKSSASIYKSTLELIGEWTLSIS